MMFEDKAELQELLNDALTGPLRLLVRVQKRRYIMGCCERGREDSEGWRKEGREGGDPVGE